MFVEASTNSMLVSIDPARAAFVPARARKSSFNILMPDWMHEGEMYPVADEPVPLVMTWTATRIR